MDHFDDDMMRYKKKAKKKTIPKSNHKHNFEEVMIIGELNNHISRTLGERCTICGKTRYKSMFISEKDESTGFYRLLNENEILKKYGNLPKVKENKFGDLEDIPGERYSNSTEEKDDMLD